MNGGHHHLKLNKKSMKIVSPWGACAFACLPVGVSASMAVFAEKMNKLLEGIDGVTCCTDNIILCTKSTFDNHLEQLHQLIE